MPLIYLAVANTEHGVNNENNIRHFLRPSLCQVLCSGLHLFKCKILGMHDILYLLERDQKERLDKFTNVSGLQVEDFNLSNTIKPDANHYQYFYHC